MSLQLKGTVKTILPSESGEGKNGTWTKQIFIIEYMDGNYPKSVAFTLFNDKNDSLKSVGSGSEVTVHFNVDSREYNGRWYTDCKAWKIESASAGTSSPKPAASAPDTDNDPLPF